MGALIEIVSATRLTEAEFWDQSALGLSLRRIGYDGRISPHIIYENRRGLPLLYNERISAPGSPDIAVFAHDDLWLDDYYVADRVLDGLAALDVMGVAGNRRRIGGQPAWHYIDASFAWDSGANLSGAVAHGRFPFGKIMVYGEAPPPVQCELLDGVFLAARKSQLIAANVRFDSRFSFHFYDMDFCRTARGAGLRLGTWPLAVTHQSSGSFGTPPWQEGNRLYLEKWGS
jgi:hypothetical protein